MKKIRWSKLLGLIGILSAPTVLHAEDCVGFNYRTAEVKQISGQWKIVDGTHWMFDFGVLESEAKRSLEIIKANRLTESCFVGRPNPIFKYLLNAERTAPSQNLAGEDCISFDPSNVSVAQAGPQNSWKLVSGSMWMVDFGMQKSHAYDALAIVQKYKFNRQCFVGRPQPSFEYWKRAGSIPTALADLTSRGVMTIGVSGGKSVNWGDVVVLTPQDVFNVANGLAAVNLEYSEANIGSGPAQGFTNRWRFAGQVVSQQPNRPLLAAGQVRQVLTQAYLKITPGVQVLELSLDDDNSIAEANESNNKFVIKIQFAGF